MAVMSLAAEGAVEGAGIVLKVCDLMAQFIKIASCIIVALGTGIIAGLIASSVQVGVIAGTIGGSVASIFFYCVNNCGVASAKASL
jgi:hypothetical protein